jgi:hypothetical protein
LQSCKKPGFISRLFFEYEFTLRTTQYPHTDLFLEEKGRANAATSGLALAKKTRQK